MQRWSVEVNTISLCASTPWRWAARVMTGTTSAEFEARVWQSARSESKFDLSTRNKGGRVSLVMQDDQVCALENDSRLNVNIKLSHPSATLLAHALGDSSLS